MAILIVYIVLTIAAIALCDVRKWIELDPFGNVDIGAWFCYTLVWPIIVIYKTFHALISMVNTMLED